MIEAFKQGMESRHKKNSFIYHKKLVDEMDVMKTPDFCTNKYAEGYKKPFSEFPNLPK